MSVLEVEETPPSQYVNGVQFAWDATCIGRLKRCGRLRHYKLDGWSPKADRVALRFGIEYHRSLQDYDILMAENFSHDDALYDVIRALTMRLEDWNPDDPKRNRKTLVRSVIWYLEKHKDDPAKTLILSDGKPAVEITFNFELDWGPTQDQPYVLCGILDKVVRFNGDLFVMDHKTTTQSFGDHYWKQFTPDDQMTLYTLAGQTVFQAPVKGVIINAASVLVNGTNFERSIVYRTQEQLNEWIGGLKTWLPRQHEDVMNDTSCHQFGGCEFRDVCSKSPQVRDVFLKSKFEQVQPWNPLAPR